MRVWGSEHLSFSTSVVRRGLFQMEEEGGIWLWSRSNLCLSSWVTTTQENIIKCPLSIYNNVYYCLQMSAPQRAHTVSLFSFLLTERQGSIHPSKMLFPLSKGLKVLTNSLSHLATACWDWHVGDGSSVCEYSLSPCTQHPSNYFPCITLFRLRQAHISISYQPYEKEICSTSGPGD